MVDNKYYNIKIINNYKYNYYKSYGNIYEPIDNDYDELKRLSRLVNELLSLNSSPISNQDAADILRTSKSLTKSELGIINNRLQSILNEQLRKSKTNPNVMVDPVKQEQERKKREEEQKRLAEERRKREEELKRLAEERRKREEEQRKQQELAKKTIIESFIRDITNKSKTADFRGWVLPNGELMSQYSDSRVVTYGGRHDHGSLVNLYMDGLKEYDTALYEKLMKMYSEYQEKYSTFGDMKESFAVEVLGWMQVSVNGRRNILYQGERWQDRLLRPFFVDYGFSYETRPSVGRYNLIEFDETYNHINEILESGLSNRYKNRQLVASV